MAGPRAGLASTHPAMLLATVAGIGFLPLAPGTWASLVAVAAAWIIVALAGPIGLALWCVAVFVVGWWSAEAVTKAAGVADPRYIVIDEIVGQAVAVFALPLNPYAYAAAFLLFRIFDILKPWPIHAIERRFLNGFGVMIDDVAAGIYAGLILYLILYAVSG